MLEKLDAAEARLLSIEDKLLDPGVFSRPEELKSLLAQKKELEPVIAEYRAYRAVVAEAAEAQRLLSSSDPELKMLAQEEMLRLTAESERLLSQLRRTLVGRDPCDDRSVIMEIRAGTGGEEAALFAADLFRMYRMFGEKNGFSIEPITVNETELGGFREICFSVEGMGAYARLKYESGVHRVQRVPKTESQGRIQTSAVSVAVLPEAEEIEIEINPSDIRVESCKSSGAGGQHINKTESAVRITHLPTGIVVECQEERSQYKNRDKAMKLLRSRLYRMKTDEQNAAIADTRRSQIGTGDRSEKIRTYNYPQSRVTDHRIGLTLYSLRSFLDGEMEQMIEALTAADIAEKLKGQ